MATFGRHSMITAHLLKPVIIYSFKVKCNTPDGHRLSLLWFIGAVRDSWGGKEKIILGRADDSFAFSPSLKQATGERESNDRMKKAVCPPLVTHSNGNLFYCSHIQYSLMWLMGLKWEAFRQRWMKWLWWCFHSGWRLHMCHTPWEDFCHL